MDPRLSLIPERVKNVKNILAVVSGKGGVGKSLFSAILSLNLAEKGYKVGLLDLDFHGSSCHIVLGVDKIDFEEEKGVIPPMVQGIKFMSIVLFSGNVPIPIRGEDITNAFIEIMAITRWGELDYLVIDMPPGMGEEILDIMRYMAKAEFLVITTPSKLALNVTRKTIEILKWSKRNIVGVIGNMCTEENNIKKFAEDLREKFLGCIPYDEHIENALGNPIKLKETIFYQAVGRILDKCCKANTP